MMAKLGMRGYLLWFIFGVCHSLTALAQILKLKGVGGYGDPPDADAWHPTVQFNRFGIFNGYQHVFPIISADHMEVS